MHAVPAAAQERRDSTRRTDSVRVAAPAPPQPDVIIDTAARDRIRADSARARADTIKAPLTGSPTPTLVEIADRYVWDREALFASGALTVLDLLERIPGLTGFNAHFIASAQTAAYLGQPGRVRVFYDGIELDVLDPRTSGPMDLAEVQLWSLEEVAIERGAAELRVWMRSWRVRRSTPSTRTDILTGDEETNVYRAFYGKRFRHGEALQLAAQRYNTSPGRFGGGGDDLALLSRLGFARRGWSIDAFVLRSLRTREPQQQLFGGAAITDFKGRRTDAYVRVGLGDTERGPWLHLTAASLGFRESTPSSGDDTTRSRAQYVAAAGWSRGVVRAELAARARVFEGRQALTPSARLGFDSRHLAASLFVERNALSKQSRGEGSVRVTPLRFLSLAATGGVERADSGGAPNGIYARGELGLRAGGLWAIGGVLLRDSVALAPPTIFTLGIVPVGERQARGGFVALRGRVWRSIHTDLWAVAWDSAGPYRPRYQSRAELFLRTRWLSRFPSGNFGILALGRHEYRSRVTFPTIDGSLDARGGSTISTLLEIRLIDAVISWQFRNVLGTYVDQVPGFFLPRTTSVYGVRWEFWN